MSKCAASGAVGEGEGERVGGRTIDGGQGLPGRLLPYGALTGRVPETAQVARLMAALESAGQAVTTCTRCAGTRFGRWGTTRRGLQRWRCRACGRTCTAATGTALAHLHSLDRLRLVAADMLAPIPRSCRALAAALDLNRMTVWRWRRLIAGTWAGLILDGSMDPAGCRTVVLRESRKASREWVRHRQDPARHPAPDRLRWIDYRRQRLPLPEPMTRYRVCVTLGGGIEHPLPPAVVTGPAASGNAADRPSGGAAPSAPVSSLADRFRSFLVRFTGPATRHLDTYVAWFNARCASADLPPARRSSIE